MISKRYFRYAQNNFDLYKVQLYIFKRTFVLRKARARKSAIIKAILKQFTLQLGSEAVIALTLTDAIAVNFEERER